MLPTPVQYQIGKSVRYNNEFKTFKYKYFYHSQNDKCRKAVDMWTLIATRLRIFIGKMIWESRNEALY